jgi:hypothetical protein
MDHDHLFLEGLELPCRVGCTAQGREYLLIEVAEALADLALADLARRRPPVQGLEWAGVRITREQQQGRT